MRSNTIRIKVSHLQKGRNRTENMHLVISRQVALLEYALKLWAPLKILIFRGAL